MIVVYFIPGTLCVLIQSLTIDVLMIESHCAAYSYVWFALVLHNVVPS